jgi:methylase of polypeptide subunit release factors
LSPYAVACARGNLDANGLSGRARIIEADIGADLPVQEDTELIVWNLPYLDEDVDNPGILEKIEEAALTDIPQGGWGRVLLQTLESISTTLTENVMVILVMRTEPEGRSRVRDWEEGGWSWRSLSMERFGSEKVEIIGFWRTGSGVEATIMDSCKSTMDEAEGLPPPIGLLA